MIELDIVNIMIILSISYLLAVLAAVVSIRSRRIRRLGENAKDKEFNKIIIEGLVNGSIVTLTDMENVYIGVTHSINMTSYDRNRLSRHLRDLLVLVVSNDKEYSKIPLDSIKNLELKEKLTNLIKKK